MVARYLVVIAATVMALAGPALAWNRPGHMVVGAMAYNLLKRDNPQVLAKALTILRGHPQYADVFVERLATVPEADRDRYLFMIAARWPDDVRQRPEYHHGSWHYVDGAIVAPADVGRVHPPEADPKAETVLTALKANLALVRAADTEPKARAIALCWVLHLIGDAHQPLHAASYFSRDLPQGDKGGNYFFVRVAAGGQTVNLHSFWDGLLLGSQTYRDAANMAVEFRQRPALGLDKLGGDVKNLDSAQWLKESFKLAVEAAYRGGTLRHAATQVADAPVLPKDYPAVAKSAAERRATLAGYRAANCLVDVLGK